MKIEIPDELVKVVAAIFSERRFPDDDGMTEVRIMRKFGITPEQFVQATHVYDAIRRQLDAHTS